LEVFENDETRATGFLRDLVYKHYKAELPETEINSGDELVRVAFTQTDAFEEFVKAAEGPRDAINILSIAAQKASDTKISIPNVPPNDYRAIRRAILDIAEFEGNPTLPEDNTQ
jgi:hypothetical protein